LEEYCFDLSGFQVDELMAIWQERLEAEPSWIRAAVIEALYQGRYKAFSVEQILQGWKRRGHPIRHFNSEFERIVLGPIDPTASKYAAMMTTRPSELMSPAPSPPTPGPISVSDHPPNEPGEIPPPSRPEEPSAFLADSSSPAVPSSLPRRDVKTDATDQVSTEAVPSPVFPVAKTSFPAIATTPFEQPEPIQQFVPETEASQFYQRLQSVARQSF
jgi:hypothetical protein